MKGCYLFAEGFQDECSQWPECGHGKVENLPPVAEEPEVGEKTRAKKDRNQLKDPKSTGRKEAARLFPLDREAPCEWQGMKFQLHNKDFRLGEDVWFVGCDQGKQSNIHHGHDKDTLKNEVGNCWRICARCHNKYHAMTDKTYPGDGFDFTTIELLPATAEELAARILEPNAKAGVRSKKPHD